MHQSGHSRAQSMQTVQFSSNSAMTPRLREDQLQRLAWVWLVPLAIGQVAITGAGVVMTA